MRKYLKALMNNQYIWHYGRVSVKKKGIFQLLVYIDKLKQASKQVMRTIEEPRNDWQIILVIFKEVNMVTVSVVSSEFHHFKWLLWFWIEPVYWFVWSSFIFM